MFYTLIDQAELRNKLIDRVDVLNKVKELFLIPKLEMMSLSMVADFYEVDEPAVKMCWNRHRDELKPDGVTLCPISFLKEQHVTLEQIGTKPLWRFYVNGVENKISNRGITCFSPRAVLRVGMLLRDSEVAKEVRTKMYRFFTYKMIWVCLEMTGLDY